ncbi:MAG: hypothetical protein ACLQVX_13500 [Limisphaerales bacterium]
MSATNAQFPTGEVFLSDPAPRPHPAPDRPTNHNRSDPLPISQPMPLHFVDPRLDSPAGAILELGRHPTLNGLL